MTKWIVVFQVTSCYDTASPWPAWISVQRDLLSGDSGWLLYQFCMTPAWLVGCLFFPASLISVLRNSFLPLQAPIQLGRGWCWRFWFPSAPGVQIAAVFENLGEGLVMTSFGFLSLCSLVALWHSLLQSPYNLPPHPLHKMGIIVLCLGSQYWWVIMKPYGSPRCQEILMLSLDMHLKLSLPCRGLFSFFPKRLKT